MAQQTRVILTSYGNDQILKAIADGTNVLVAAMVYGDGGGYPYIPQPSQESLVNQIGILTNVTKVFDESDGFIYFSSTIPANTPAFIMRELGLLDNFGKLLAVAVIPDTSKPAEEEGLEVSLPISLGFKTSTGEVMIVYVDQGEGYPDKTWVINYVASIDAISGRNW
jgi:phage-related tail fiber protein